MIILSATGYLGIDLIYALSSDIEYGTLPDSQG